MDSFPRDPDRRSVFRVVNRGFSSNTYLCRPSESNECVIVDPGLDGEGIDRELSARGLVPRAVLCTHGHFDHLGSASLFQKKYGIPVHLHSADVKTSKSSNFLLMACKLDYRITVPEVDVLIGDGFTANIAGDEFQFLSSPGHTPGSSVIRFGGSIFTGDTLYRSAVGLVSLPGEDLDQLKKSIFRILDSYPEDCVVFPGHGGSGPLGDIKRDNLPLRRFLGLEGESSPRPGGSA